MKKYSVKFGQAAIGTFGWLTGIMVLTRGSDQILAILLTAAICGVIISGVLTLLYPMVWEGIRWNKAWKIVISAFLNLTAGLILVGLLMPNMLLMILPWLPAMLLLSILLHTICSMFYSATASEQ